MIDEILFETLSGPAGDIGLITLNRPQMLNALTQAMCIAMYDQMALWEQTNAIKAVVIRGAGEKAFCAGGDIRSLYQQKNHPLPEKPFFWYEYRLNRAIFHYTKPYIALLDGLTMGGGAGLSVNGAFRVASEKLKFAMPETGIGFFPDVGGSYFLPHCTDKSGWYLALTGNAVDIKDAYYAGIVTHHVTSENFPALLDALVTAPWNDNLAATATEVIAKFAITPSDSKLQTYSPIISHCFSQNSVADIITQLNRYEHLWAQQAAHLLLARSPLSLKVTLEQLRRGAQLSFDDCMRMEYHIALQFLRSHDFYEGIRAAIIDKDRNPQWQPKKLAEVSDLDVAAFFPDHKNGHALQFEAVE